MRACVRWDIPWAGFCHGGACAFVHAHVRFLCVFVCVFVVSCRDDVRVVGRRRRRWRRDGENGGNASFRVLLFCVLFVRCVLFLRVVSALRVVLGVCAWFSCAINVRECLFVRLDVLQWN